MDLMTLDSNNQPAKMVEKYDTLLWAERYTGGDFQLTTGDVDRFMTLLPEGQVVTLRESTVPMIVETHLIDRKKNQPQLLTIKGREFTSVIDRRVTSDGAAGTAEWTTIKKTPSDVAWYIMDQICVAGLLDAADIFEAAKVTFPAPADYNTSTGPNRSFVIPRGNLLKIVMDFLNAEAKLDVSTTPDTPAVVPHGFRAVRPGIGATPIQLQIYTGTDRSATVYFDGRRNLLDDGSYLFSKVGSANTAYCIGQSNTFLINKDAAAVTGLARRVTLVDASQTQITDEELVSQGKISLAEAHETAIFDGSINQDLSPYVYNVDYGLGDIVKLVGDYGLDTKARVTEYIRSEDATGFKAYPTLVTIDE